MMDVACWLRWGGDASGDTGLEIAPGNDAENAEHLISDPGNIWNSVPKVCESDLCDKEMLCESGILSL